MGIEGVGSDDGDVELICPRNADGDVVEPPVSERSFDERGEVFSEFVVEVFDASANLGCEQER